jgi:FKBP-type peptidyl-prolyl cis-trans isomerase FkpA
LKYAFAICFVGVATVGCASAQESKGGAAPPAKSAASANPECAPPPKELTMKDLQKGTGREVKFRSAVTVGYTGWLYDGCAKDLKGQEFDSNVKAMTPLAFMVGAGRVIKGWDEGLIGVREKGKRLLIVPPDKGYGERGSGGGKIPPNATLVFEVYVDQIVFQPGEDVPSAPPKPAPAAK